MPDSSSHFLLIGERLSAHRPKFRDALTARDNFVVLQELKLQQDAGATHLNLGTAAMGERETDAMLWLLETILPALNPAMGLLLDSVSENCLAKALFMLKGRANTVINPHGGPPDNWQKFLPLAKQHGCGLVGSFSGDWQPTATAFERGGIDPTNQYFDPLVLPLGHDLNLPAKILAAVQPLRRGRTRAHILAGLSNISFNLPARGLLNRTYLAMLMASGVDAVICDPCDTALRETIIAARALLGQDEFLASYLSELNP